MLTARPATTLDDLHQAQAIDTAAWVAGDPLAVGTPGALAWWHASSAPDRLDEHLRLWSDGDRVVAWTWHDGGEVEWGVWTGEPRRDRAVVAAVTAAIVAEAGDGTVAMWTAEDDAPTVATLATALPVMVPMSAEPTTATFAGPPRIRPIASIARSAKKRAPPAAFKTFPNRMKSTMMVVATASGEPKTPLVSSARYGTS